MYYMKILTIIINTLLKQKIHRGYTIKYITIRGNK